LFFSLLGPFIFPDFFLAVTLLTSLFFLSVFSSFSDSKMLVVVKYHFFLVTLFLVFFYSLLSEFFLLKYSIFYNSLVSDLFIYVLKLAVLLFSTFFLKAAWDRWEMLLVFQIGLLSILLLLSSNDFILFFTSLELLSLVLYILAGSSKNSLLSAEAALKYFVFGALASILVLLGISFVYASTGLLNFSDYALLFLFFDFSSVDVDLFLIFGMFSLYLGFLVKLGLVPFHFWVPSVYLGSPFHVVGIFSTVAKMATLYIFVRLFYLFSPLYFSFVSFDVLFLFLSLFSIVLGYVGAWGQTNIKLFVAYSGIGNTGLLVFLYIYFTSFSFFSFWFYFINYFSSYLLFFFFFFLIPITVNTWNGLFYLIRLRPFMFSLFVLLLFSLAGLPPLYGFWGKFFVITSLFTGFFLDNLVSFLLPFFVSFILLLSALYYFRILTNFFYSPSFVTFVTFDFSFSFYFLLFCVKYSFILYFF